MSTDLRKLRKCMEKELDAKRYEHTLGVAYISAALAMKYGADAKKAQIAGLLHDCAKCIPDDKKIQLCEKYKLGVSEVEKSNPGLLHAKLGSFLAKEEYGILDEEILSAILNHTTGKPDMSLLDKIVFIADFIEPSRKPLPNLEEIRYLAFQDIDCALLQVLEDTLEYLMMKGITMDPETQNTYNYYKSIQKLQIEDALTR